MNIEAPNPTGTDAEGIALGRKMVELYSERRTNVAGHLPIQWSENKQTFFYGEAQMPMKELARWLTECERTEIKRAGRTSYDNDIQITGAINGIAAAVITRWKSQNYHGETYDLSQQHRRELVQMCGCSACRRAAPPLPDRPGEHQWFLSDVMNHGLPAPNAHR